MEEEETFNFSLILVKFFGVYHTRQLFYFRFFRQFATENLPSNFSNSLWKFFNSNLIPILTDWQLNLSISLTVIYYSTEILTSLKILEFGSMFTYHTESRTGQEYPQFNTIVKILIFFSIKLIISTLTILTKK